MVIKMIKYCGAALIALFAVLLLRAQKSEFSGIVSFAAGILLLGAAVVTLTPTLEMVGNLIEGSGFKSNFTALIKALGITLAVQFTSELCRDAGESSIASKLEFIGKAEILLLCLPLLNELLAFAGQLIG